MTNVCVIEGCDRPTHARGWCCTHYTRIWRYGDPEVIRRPYSPAGRSLEERFWALVDRSDRPDACWQWLGAITAKGYGRYCYKSQARRYAHRYAYELSTGIALAIDQHIDHLCHNADPDCYAGKECRHRRCCNPAHLEPVTAVENARRATLRMQASEPHLCPGCDRPCRSVQGLAAHRRLAHDPVERERRKIRRDMRRAS